MSFYSTAELVFGVPVYAYDDEGDSTPFWDEENDDWIDLPDDFRFEFHYFGHYDNVDGDAAILRIKSTPEWRGDCWEPKPVDPGEMVVRELDIYKAAGQAAALKLPVDFRDAKWYLVASYG